MASLLSLVTNGCYFEKEHILLSNLQGNVHLRESIRRITYEILGDNRLIRKLTVTN